MTRPMSKSIVKACAMCGCRLVDFRKTYCSPCADIRSERRDLARRGKPNKMGNRGARPRITDEQRAELVRVFHEQGYKAAGELAVQMGFSRTYPSSQMGLRRPRWKTPSKPPPVRKRHYDRSNDPRWAKARAIGVVLA
jgi:hypothetical protein